MIAHSLGPYCPHKMSCVVPLLKPGMDPGFQAGGVGDKRIFFFQIRIHIVLINYQPRQIPKNHCFIIYQDQLFEILFERYGYFLELGYWHFLELGNEYFLGLEHRHFPELGNEYFLELQHPHFLELE